MVHAAVSLIQQLPATLSQNMEILHANTAWSTSDPRAKSGPRQLVTRPAELFVNLFLVLQAHFPLLQRVSKIVIISSAALRASVTHATDFNKDNENWLLVFKKSAKRGFLALGSNGKTILGPREEKVGLP
jgi:hypothetical protein